ncbi:hypothetical protein PR003_g29491 [Phytophthora rubi]|uniref:Uncharacterized protein n=1 Tax=Phytophthora rubi TaxID=129364 RepID=A0A6A4BPJ0_9STRA|nr:hypothetical protein PR002_g22130 [Phytophthora rubi]KAE9274854.1 hypothetical protein PR003_g29491 [Phytophthora rubi]
MSKSKSPGVKSPEVKNQEVQVNQEVYENEYV